MKKPRQSILGDLDLSTDLSTEETAPEAKPAKAKPVTVKAEAKEPESQAFRTTITMPQAVHDKLLEICFYEKRRKVNDLLLEGIDHVLKARRHPSVKELSKKAS